VRICPVALGADIPDMMIMCIAMITKLLFLHDIHLTMVFLFTVSYFLGVIPGGV